MKPVHTVVNLPLSSPSESVVAANMRPRVLHIGKFYPPHRGGMETHLSLLCGSLQASFEAEVLVASENSHDIHELISGVKVSRLATIFSLKGAPICPGMVTAIRKTKSDIVHLHWPNPVGLTSYLLSGHRGPLIISWHSDVVRQKVLSRAFMPILRIALHRCQALIISSAEYAASSPVLVPYRARCRVIPFGIPLEDFERPSLSATAAIRTKYGSRLVLSVGRLVSYKGFEYLIRAMREVRGNLLIVGEGPLHSSLKYESRRQGVADRVFFLGSVESVVPFYHACRVFVLASTTRAEAFGIVQIEAMACGKPIVNTKLDSGVPAVSRHGQTGITVQPADPIGLAQAINRLLDDEHLRNRLGRAALARARTEFSIQRMASRTQELYSAILRAH